MPRDVPGVEPKYGAPAGCQMLGTGAPDLRAPTSVGGSLWRESNILELEGERLRTST
jgi:hypothetical protein